MISVYESHELDNHVKYAYIHYSFSLDALVVSSVSLTEALLSCEDGTPLPETTIDTLQKKLTEKIQQATQPTQGNPKATPPHGLPTQDQEAIQKWLQTKIIKNTSNQTTINVPLEGPVDGALHGALQTYNNPQEEQAQCLQNQKTIIKYNNQTYGTAGWKALLNNLTKTERLAIYAATCSTTTAICSIFTLDGISALGIGATCIAPPFATYIQTEKQAEEAWKQALALEALTALPGGLLTSYSAAKPLTEAQLLLQQTQGIQNLESIEVEVGEEKVSIGKLREDLDKKVKQTRREPTKENIKELRATLKKLKTAIQNLEPKGEYKNEITRLKEATERVSKTLTKLLKERMAQNARNAVKLMRENRKAKIPKGLVCSMAGVTLGVFASAIKDAPLIHGIKEFKIEITQPCPSLKITPTQLTCGE
ncbi:MAG: hypothetical protein GSR85_04400 [Desulfurococcales archaeon]|nr:hypothetical protein [Desulfurococcales archaeon]